MSAAEVAHRAVEYRKKAKGRRMNGGWENFAATGHFSCPVLPGLAEAIDKASTHLGTDASRAAARYMAGHFAALGVEWPQFTLSDRSDTVWHLDPVTGKHWPDDRYCFDIGYRGSTTMGDIKYVWEFSRLQFLQPVALHARLSGDEEALAFVERAIASWYASNPPFQGVAWSSGIELSLRAISLLVVTSLIGEQLSEDNVQRIQEMLRAHSFWLARYPSRFSSANNHLVSEEAALYLIGATCPFVPGATRMMEHAEAALVHEAGLQIHSDGVAAEQSPTYGALTSELLLLCAWVGGGLGKPFPASVRDRLVAFATWIRWLAEPDGTVPAIGDDDEGRVLTLGQKERGYPTSVAAAIAGFVGQPTLVPPYAPTLRNALVPPVSPAPPPSGTRVFAEGGYTVHRTTEGGRAVTLVIDHAPLGYLAIAAHGHADALSFTLAVDGRQVFVDPGTFLYHSGHAWRDWFRNTRAHNTVAVEGAEQSIISGAFNWAHKAEARLGRTSDGPFALEASHDGYQKRFGLRHRRCFGLNDGVLTLEDALIGAGERAAEIVLQLAPDCEAFDEGTLWAVRRGDTQVAQIVFPEGGTVVRTCGGEPMDGGWVSPHFGTKLAAARLAWTGRIGEAGVITRIILS